MSTKHLAVCPRCHEFYSTDRDPSSVKCQDCGSALQLVEHGYDLYSTLSDEEKTAFKQNYIQDHFPGAKPYRKPFTPMPQSGWVGFMGCCGWAAVFGLLIAGLFSFAFGSVAIGIALLISAPFAGGSAILFSIVAEDVRHIRNRVDELHHNQQYNK